VLQRAAPGEKTPERKKKPHQLGHALLIKKKGAVLE